MLTNRLGGKKAQLQKIKKLIDEDWSVRRQAQREKSQKQSEATKRWKQCQQFQEKKIEEILKTSTVREFLRAQGRDRTQNSSFQNPPFVFPL